VKIYNKYLILILVFISYNKLFAQSKSDSLILIEPASPAEFKGGTPALIKYISDSVTKKINVCFDDKSHIQKVFVNFLINENGKISDVKVIRTSNVPQIDSVFVRAIRNMPDWIPGTFNGKPVKQYYNLPFNFNPK
jgi:TonB family protein